MNPQIKINKGITIFYGLTTAAVLSMASLPVAEHIEQKNNLKAVWQDINALAPTVRTLAAHADVAYYQRFSTLINDHEIALKIANDVSNSDTISSAVESAKLQPEDSETVCEAISTLRKYHQKLSDSRSLVPASRSETELCFIK